MSGNSCASALQTAPIVSDFWRAAAARAAPRAVGRQLARSSSAARRLAAVSRVRRHQRAWNVSLYLPICTSSPSSRRWDSIRERFT